MSLPPLRITWVCTLASLEKTRIYLLVRLPQLKRFHLQFEIRRLGLLLGFQHGQYEDADTGSVRPLVSDPLELIDAVDKYPPGLL